MCGFESHVSNDENIADTKVHSGVEAVFEAKITMDTKLEAQGVGHVHSLCIIVQLSCAYAAPEGMLGLALGEAFTVPPRKQA
jgi:hypothetical protein